MEELVYRPPFEAGSFLLQVTHGCSHNRCSFCTMYREVPFSLFSEEEIDAQLAWAARRMPGTERVFLENGDPFALSADRLAAIARKVKDALPRVETIAMYASILNIRNKTDNELKQLRSLGINELNIGVESGLDDALRLMNKGYSAAEAEGQLLRLKEAGIDYGANLIFGAAGSGRGGENAMATAELLNKTEPYLIFTGTIHADPGCPLYDDLQSGRFMEPTFGEYLDEEQLLLEKLELQNCYYFGLHPSNVVPMQGMLPSDKQKLLNKVNQKRIQLADRLEERPIRYGEGGIL